MSSSKKRQDAEMQNQHNVDNTAKPSATTNPTIMGKNNNENSFPSGSTNEATNISCSELIINENQGFVSEQLREDDMVANVKQTSKRDNYNSKSCISDQAEDSDIDTEKKGKHNKKKNNSKVDTLQSNRNRCEHDTIDIPQGDHSGDQNLNCDEVIEFLKKLMA